MKTSVGKRPYILALILVTLMPFLNYFIADLIWGMPDSDSYVLVWARGFGILLGILLVIGALGSVPIIGPVLIALIGRPLGFPDVEAENAVRSIFKRPKPPSPNAPVVNNDSIAKTVQSSQ